MATVGQQLGAPEAGWRRYDDRHADIRYIGTWTQGSDAPLYNSTITYSNDANGRVSFVFKGTKIRIISYSWSNRVAQAYIKIDGNSATYSQQAYGNLTQVILYEKTGLSNSVHTVEITANTAGSLYFDVDAIDIDDTGEILTISPEATPAATIDFASEVLASLSAGSVYTIGGTDYTADTGGKIPLIPAWFGTTLSIIRKGNGTTTSDSAAQSLAIPSRPAAPTIGSTNETTLGANDGTLTGVTTAMEYRKGLGGAWTNTGGTSVTGLAPDTYYVRVKSTATTFASPTTMTTIAAGVAEPTPSTGTVIRYVTKIKSADGFDILYPQTSADQVRETTAYSNIGTAAGASQADINAAIDAKINATGGGGVVSGSAGLIFSAYAAAAQSFSAGATTKVNFATAETASDAYNTATSTFTAPEDGTYLIAGGVRFDTTDSTTNRRVLMVYVNGVLEKTIASENGAQLNGIYGSVPLPLIAGNTVTLMLYVSAATTQLIPANAAAENYFTASKIFAGTAAPESGSTDWADITNKPSAFAPAPHTHGLVDVTGLDSALASKANVGQSYTKAESDALYAPIGSTGGGGVPILNEITYTTLVAASATVRADLNAGMDKYDLRTVRAVIAGGTAVIRVTDRATGGNVVYESNAGTEIYDIALIPVIDKDAANQLHIAIENVGSAEISANVTFMITQLA